MNKLDEMWTALAAYQPKADAAGHGESWAKMCSEKTVKAADDAALAAAALAAALAAAASAAAYDYASAIRAMTIAADYAQRAIDHITEA